MAELEPQGGREKKTLDGTTNELRDNAIQRECASSGSTGVGTIEGVKNAQGILMPPLECTLADSEVQDEYTLRKMEPNEPLKLVLLDLGHSDATARIGTELTLEMRAAM